ncbi:MAG: zf-HC2 domain-containing protein [Clostridia bacterium]|jgi:hypothetical protein
MKNECDVVKDLLPSYAEDLLSDNTNQFVKEHLDSCQECRKVYDGMKKINYNKEDDEQIEINHLKKYSRHMLVLKVVLVILVFIIITLPLFFVIRFNLNKNITSKAINNVNEYKNVNNYLLQITEHNIDFERNTESFHNSKYFYKDNQYKKEMHSETPGVNIQNADSFEYGNINSKEKVEIIETQKVCYNVKANYILQKKDGFLDFMMIALQPFSEDYGTLPNIWFQAGYNLRTDKYNGRKCYVLRLGDKSSYGEIWIDKEQNTLVRTVDEIYKRSYNEKVYSIKSDVVTNEDVTLPDLTGYTIKDSEDNVPSEYIGIYEKLGI